MWAIPPSEFWAMTPQEWWWIYDAKHPGKPKVGRSSFTKAEVEAIAARQRAEMNDHG